MGRSDRGPGVFRAVVEGFGLPLAGLGGAILSATADRPGPRWGWSLLGLAAALAMVALALIQLAEARAPKVGPPPR